jgi:hypothetical protein
MRIRNSGAAPLGKLPFVKYIFAHFHPVPRLKMCGVNIYSPIHLPGMVLF